MDDDEELELLLAEELDLAEEWGAFLGGRWATNAIKERFLNDLRGKVSNPDAIDGISFCDSCGQPEWEDELSHTGTGEDICESCWGEWTDCSDCEERFPDSDLYPVSNGSVCESCRVRHYTYCDDCDEYYPNEDGHSHSRSGCCSSPQEEFAIRNDGQDPLPNDTRVSVGLPSGVIDPEGVSQITRYLRRYGYYLYDRDWDALGHQWQAKNGNFTKRLSAYLYKREGTKLPQEVLSQVGVIARDHSNAVSVEIEVTRQLNLPSYEFANDGSCWWNSYSESRCALKTNGGFGLRSFSGREVTGRAWVMPLRKDDRGYLVPTFETLTPDAFVVFNGYGDLQGYAAPRILAHMAGWTYRKIGFECSPMYVNAGGYLVAPEVIAKQYENGSLDLSVRQHSDLFAREQREKEAQLVCV